MMSIMRARGGGWAPGQQGCQALNSPEKLHLGLCSVSGTEARSPETQWAFLKTPNAVVPEASPNPRGTKSLCKPMCYLEALGLLGTPC